MPHIDSQLSDIHGFPKYLWSPKTGYLYVSDSQRPFLCAETVAPVKFESLDDINRYLHEQNLEGSVGRIINNQNENE
jgi:hypothetical protein